MASDVAETIVNIAEDRDSQKEFLVAQMCYSKYVHLRNASPCRTGQCLQDSPDTYKETSVEALLNDGWRIERQFAVSKIVELDAPYGSVWGHEHPDKGKQVLIDVQHFILSRRRSPAAAPAGH